MGFPNKAGEARAARRGFGPLPCILCGADAVVTVDLDDLEACHCGECDQDFTTAEVRDHLARWQRVLSWLDTAPVREEG